MFVVIPFPFVFEDFFSFLKIEKPQVVVPAETKIKNRIMIYNHLPAEMWGARANGWPEGRHLMLASNDPLVHWHLNWRGNQWNPITHFHFIPDNDHNNAATTTAMHMHDVCLCLSLFASFLTWLMRSPIDMPYSNPSRETPRAVYCSRTWHQSSRPFKNER